MKKAFAFFLVIMAICIAASCSAVPQTETSGAVTSASESTTTATTTKTASSETTTTAESSTSESTLPKPTLTLIGHVSMKIKTSQGIVIYIDPYYPGDYSEYADIILVSHEHSDHNQVNLCKQNDGCRILRVQDTNIDGSRFNTFEIYGVGIEPVPASNKNHPPEKTNGFVLTFDGVTVYHASDTSKLDSMADLASRNIDYAFYPIDGVYNMDAAEAVACAEMVGAKHNTPFHILKADVDAFKPANLLPVAYGETIELGH